MEPKEQARAPRISGINVAGEAVEVDYSANLINVVVFFEPVSKNSLDTVELVRLLSQRYEKLSVGFWFVLEPRLSCMFRGEEAQRTLDRLGLFSNIVFDANSMIVLQSGVRIVPAVLVVDSNSFIKSQFEGEISFREIERTIQARLALSGYRDDLPNMGGVDFDFSHARGGSILKQLGYATGDYVFSSIVVPEANQQFSLPDFCLLNTIYPHGAWYVSRDFIGGNAGSTVYVSCAKDESIIVFAGSDEEAVLRIHTSIESPQYFVLGKDVKKIGGVLEVNVNECRPYEILSTSGDTDILISLQVLSGSVRLYTVEFCQQSQVINGQPLFW